jgi:hypothetical protein
MKTAPGSNLAGAAPLSNYLSLAKNRYDRILIPFAGTIRAGVNIHIVDLRISALQHALFVYVVILIPWCKGSMVAKH